MQGKKYTLDFLEDTGIGPSDENGLTGCSSYAVPYFYNSEENTMHFIKTNSSQLEGAQGLFLSSYLNWVAMESSEGGSVSIVGIELNEDETELTIKFSAGYQEGGASGQLVISVDNGLFELYNFSIDPQDSPHGEESGGDEPEGEQDTPDYQ